MISWPIAKATVLEHLRPGPLAALFAWALVAAASGTAFEGPGRAFVLLSTLVLGAGLVGAEIDSGHAQLLVLRPITRAQLVGGRFAGAAVLLCVAGLVAFAAAFARGRPALSSLPLGLLEALAWLATLTAVSTVTRGGSNVAWVLGAAVGWFALRQSLPFLIRRDEVASLVRIADAHMGPQSLQGAPWATVAWDGLWLAGAWLVAVLLFRDRELARRRA